MEVSALREGQCCLPTSLIGTRLMFIKSYSASLASGQAWIWILVLPLHTLGSSLTLPFFQFLKYKKKLSASSMGVWGEQGRTWTALACSNWSLSKWQPCGLGLKWDDHSRGAEQHTAKRVASPSQAQFWADWFRKRWLGGCSIFGCFAWLRQSVVFFTKNTWLLIECCCHALSPSICHRHYPLESDTDGRGHVNASPPPPFPM